ncbi:hypothetical protein DTO166G4_2172 [Paecilomyces variotii]|nr:hypothetical protein DTO166G4_2172 [Paecilomyces variotii]KAJ9222303.1 hypothetical protein DTO169C6_5432 [Paecilomyces variotii]KAJ9236878.1 hypothetical protein DTO166G5_3854 [Paecilomyces variotii]KAJ9254089.1 hypothetical protein DTO195F2_6845 [Paecilomyces variotii]
MATIITHTQPSRLHRFQQAMSSVYGDLSTITDPSNWTPPPKSGGHRGRYLWTDAFGVLNFLTLHQETNALAPTGSKDDKYLILARRLVDTVHNILGRTRDGTARLPGATDQEPLRGGLRIGKMDERGPDGDGQYHHYLTIWMFALNRVSLASGDPQYNRLAVQLAEAIHPRFFINRKSTRPRMVWKMAMDLSIPLVSSEGNLDPIDGYVVFRLLQAAAMEMNEGKKLDEEIGDYKRVMERKGEHFVSSDPLDLGMTLWTAHWFADREEWATRLTGRCFEQIYELFEIDRYLERNIRYRLAFREFGTALGIRCQSERTADDKERTKDLTSYADAIVDVWDPYMDVSLSDGFDEDDLRPITRVMYATALIPGAFRSGYLGPEPKTIP